MNRFEYQVYYEYSGPTTASPLRMPKTADEIQDALSTFPSDLGHFLCDPDAQVTTNEMKRTTNSIFVIVATKDSEQQVNDAVGRCLNSFDLFGKKLEKA